MEKKAVIEKIISIEWTMFDAVENIAGRASCQDDYDTFRIMRQSQLEAWNTETLESYLNDLKTAQENGSNLLSEKYAYMMEYTSPDEFEPIRDQLPEITEDKKRLIEAIVPEHVKWLEQLAPEYPMLVGGGRPIHSSEDEKYDTSFETYLRGELCTYSIETLKKYRRFQEHLLEQGKNMNLDILKNMAREYGYASLEQAEERMSHS